MGDDGTLRAGEDVAVDGFEDERADEGAAGDVFCGGVESEGGVGAEEGGEGFARRLCTGGAGGRDDGGEKLGKVEVKRGGDAGYPLSERNIR